MLQYFETILPSVESLWSSPQDEGSLMGGGADGGLSRHQKWSPSWILLRIRNQVKTVRLDGFHSDVIYGRPFVSKLWHDIRAVFPTYTCNHSCYTIYVRFFVTYTCVLFPSIWPFSYKRAYICAQKSPYICGTNRHVVYGVTESRRIRGTELYRQQKPLHVRWSWKVTSVWIKHGRNGRVNFEVPRQRICWNPWIVSWETDCTLFHECWPKQRSFQLEVSVWQAKHDS